MSLRKKAFSGVKWNTLSSGISAVGSIVQLYILVRFIEPSDFGLMAMVNVFLFFIMSLLDFGMNNAIIHKERITQNQLSTLYWFSVLLGFILAAILWVGSYFVAWFYGEGELVALIKTLSIVLILGALANQFKTLLTKKLWFDNLAFINITSFVVGFTATVSLAVNGYGVWALVYGTLAKTIVDSLMTISFGKKIFWPQWVMEFKEVKFFINFGLYQIGERLLNFFNQQFDVLIIGKVLGTEALGIYDVIKRFLLRPSGLINPIITSVLFPIMSHVQKEEKQLASIYLKQINYICSINFPIYLLLFFNAEVVIEVLLEETWLEYVGVFKVYVLVVMGYCTGSPVGTLILAKGRAEMGFYWNLVAIFLIPVSVYFGTFWMLIGVTYGLFLMQMVLIVPNYFYLVRPLIPTTFSIYFEKILLPLSIALIATGASTFIIQSILIPSLLQLVISILLSGVFYLGLSWKFNSSFFFNLKALLQNE